MRSWCWYSKVLFAVAVLAFAWFVWPTAWRYEPWAQGGLVRIQRLTGKAQMLTRKGWRDLSRPDWQTELEEAVAADKEAAAQRDRESQAGADHTVSDARRLLDRLGRKYPGARR